MTSTKLRKDSDQSMGFFLTDPYTFIMQDVCQDASEHPEDPFEVRFSIVREFACLLNLHCSRNKTKTEKARELDETPTRYANNSLPFSSANVLVFCMATGRALGRPGQIPRRPSECPRLLLYFNESMQRRVKQSTEDVEMSGGDKPCVILFDVSLSF
jgi:hypothetical protein